jgi:hypothetical protein
MGFLPNGDLIVVSLDRKIYLYLFKNKPTTNSTLWKYSQIYDIEIPESLKGENIYCYVYQTKLFLFPYGQLMIQWDLLTMTLDMQYSSECEGFVHMAINRNKTLFAISFSAGKTNIFSMETGMLISSYKSKG